MRTSYEQNMIVFAARYAHSRNTGAALMVVNHIISVWDELDTDTKNTLLSERHEAQYCKDDWDMLDRFDKESK